MIERQRRSHVGGGSDSGGGGGVGVAISPPC